MVALGTFHEAVPREKVANLHFRVRLLRLCDEDVRYRPAVMEMCRQDLRFFISAFVWQFNPAHQGQEIGPFIAWPFQDEAALTIADHWWKRVDLLIEKSREMGASWLCLIVQVWFCLFHNWQKFLDISHNEKAVADADDSDSLWWKIQFVLDHLPPWMTRGVWRKKFGFTFPGSKSSISGAATTERAGVGGRAKVFLDEFSKQRDDFAILGQTADTGPRVFNGTHYGVGTAFYQLTQRPDLHKLVMHWSQHPEKNRGLYRFNSEAGQIEVLDPTYEYPEDFQFVMDGTPTGGPFPGLRSPWYDAEVKRRASARDVAMHLDINPKGSVSQFFDALTIAGLVRKAWAPLWEGSLHYERDTGLPTTLVPQAGGPLRLWVHPTPEGGVTPGEFVIGGDPATGTGATPSCLSIVRKRTGEKVGEYVNPFITPEAFGVLIVAVCWLFKDQEGNGAYVAWEQQGPGVKVGQVIVNEIGYRRIYYRVDEFDMRTSTSTLPGWVPHPGPKRLLLEDYRAAIASGQFVNPSQRALEQCLDYRYDARGNPEHPKMAQTDDPSAGAVNHGDLVIADGLAWMLAKATAGARPRKQVQVIPVGSLAWRRQRYEEQSEEEESVRW